MPTCFHFSIKSLKPSLGFLLLACVFMSKAQAGLPPLVDAHWLHSNLDKEDLVVLDLRSGIDEGGDRAAFEQKQIPGSIYSSYTDDGWRETRGGVPGLLPATSTLERLIGSLGISNDSFVVVVPAGSGPTDFGSAARIYWTFKLLGHDQVTLLNGGVAGWEQAGYELVSDEADYESARFHADFREDLLTSVEEINERLQSSPASLIDARPAAFFTGDIQAGPVASPGTLPGAVNFEYQEFLVERDGVWYLDEEILSRRLASSDLAGQSNLVSFCNTGHWAATNWFALSELAGLEGVSLYDGSMAEWASDSSRELQVPPRGISRFFNLFN